MTVNVDIDDAEPHLSRLLERVAAGERVVISRGGAPIADLVPHQRRKFVLGTLRGRIQYDDSIFDGPDPDVEEMFDANPDEFDNDAAPRWPGRPLVTRRQPAPRSSYARARRRDDRRARVGGVDLGAVDPAPSGSRS